MPSPLLEAKLFLPAPRPGMVPRQRLFDTLDRAFASKLTLVSAPAGFGKTTLLAAWVAASRAEGRSAVWLSLDATDNHPTAFWTYVVAALRTVAPGIGETALSLLDDEQPCPGEVVLTPLLNDLNGLPDHILLTLDDYHLVDAPEVQAGVSFFVEHAPGNVHLLIATRADPAVPLARLRARGELVEIRSAELRFTPDEAATYLNEVMGLALSVRDVVALGERTEGWIAALQLAALSLQGRSDPAGFIAGFAGTDRYIVDYLVEEVLQRQPAGTRDFLLRTSILDRLTGPLCDAVTGLGGGRAMLEELDRKNLFLVPLDDHRGWYRYHRLFADVLQARLLDDQPDDLAEMHSRACQWHRHHGDRAEAIRHAFAGGLAEQAADLVEEALPGLRRDRQEVLMRRWLDAIPEDMFEVRPVLAVGYVSSRLVSGDIENVEIRLRQAERWVPVPGQGGDAPEPDRTGMVVVDQEAFQRLPGSIAVYRTALARSRGDMAATMTHARRVLDVIGEDDHLERGSAAGFLGIASWSGGDLDAAHRWWTEAAHSLEKAGHVADVLGCAIALGDIRIAQGRLHDAMVTYQRGLELATGHGDPDMRGVADMHVGIAEVLRRRNDLRGAREHLLVAEELGAHAGLPQNAYRRRVAMALVRRAEGDRDGAVDLLDEAEGVFDGDYFPDVRPIAALRARLWIAQGRLPQAHDWARRQELSPHGELTYLREFEHLTLARLLLAESRLGDVDLHGIVLPFLGRLLDAAEDGGRLASVLEIHVLRALAEDAAGDRGSALGSLQKALQLAEPEGHVAVFTDERPAIVALLRSTAQAPEIHAGGRRLLGAAGAAPDAPVAPGLADPLTDRELDVLRLLGGDLAGPEIARELYISLNTLRTHTKSIYTKLGVGSRRAAVRRAVELDLIPR